MFSELANHFIIAFASIFVVVNPVSTAFIFASLAGHETLAEQKLIARRAAITATIVLLIFALIGNLILSFFSISIASFKIAGGIILFGIANQMIWGKTTRFPDDPETLTDHSMVEDLAIVPIAIPFISGPGSIATTMILTSGAANIAQLVPIFVAIVLLTFISFLVMRHSHYIVDRFGDLGKRIFSKIFGLILAVIAVQFVIDGAREIMPGLFA